MIHLNVKEYCHKCLRFKPMVEVTYVYAGEGE